MSSSLRIRVENPEDLLNAGEYGAGALIRVQSGSASSGPFSDLAGTGSTPTVALVVGTYIYTAYDPAGTPATWYQTRFESSDGLRTSTYSGAFQSGGLLASLYDLKQRLNYAATETSRDEDLIQLLQQATDYLHSYTERYFLPDPISGTTVYTFDGYDAVERGHCLIVRRGIRSIAQLRVAPATGGTLVVVPATDFFLRPSPQDLPPGHPASRIRLSDIPSGSSPFFYPGYGNVEVTGTFGFASVPGEIEDICLTLAVRSWLARQAGQNDVVGTAEAGQPLVSRYLSRRDVEVLDRYRGAFVA